MEIKFKIRGKEFAGYPKDYILDNGECLQLCTHNDRVLIYKGYDRLTSVLLTATAIKSIDLSKLIKVEQGGMIYYYIPEDTTKEELIDQILDIITLSEDDYSDGEVIGMIVELLNKEKV